MTSSQPNELPESDDTPHFELISDEAENAEGILYVGIDLGTSRTSIAASNGVRATVPSVVGYPKDVVGQKLFGRSVLFGDEAIEKRMSLDFHRPLEKGVLKGTAGEAGNDGDVRAARDLINEIIRRARPRKDEIIYAVIGAPAEASIKSKSAILEVARESCDSVMICSEPFSVAYGQEMLEDVLVIDIGAGTVDLCRMHGTMPEDADQITLETAGDFVDDQFAAAIRESNPKAQFSKEMLKGIKQRFASVAEEMEPCNVQLPVEGKPTELDLTEELRGACRAIVPPIVDGLRKLIATFDPEFQDRLKDRVLLAGGGSQIKGLDIAIEREMHEQLGSGRVVRIEEPMYGGATGALKIAHDMPEEYWERLK
ncbi:MAG: rod shape-determining protein [Planctomycetes bacterium]|nr:rod shape-determining protein [Planctomycetota bacterium]